MARLSDSTITSADLGRSPDRIIAINAYPAAGCKAPSYLLASSSQVNQEKALRLPWRSELWPRPVDWVLVPAMVVEEVVTEHCGDGGRTKDLQYCSGKGAPERQVERWSTIKEGRKVGGGGGGGGG